MQEKLNYFRSKLPQVLKDATGIYIAGGAITSEFMSTEINDIDVYCDKKYSFDKIIDSIMTDGYKPIFISNKAVTFSKGSVSEKPIQVMHYRWFKDEQDILNDFDFSACMAVYSNEKGFYLGDDFLLSLASRFVKININTKYPLISLLRVDKYKEKGFKFKKSDILKLMLKVNNLKIENWYELEDQLGGFYGELSLSDKDKKESFSMVYALDNIERIFKNTKNSFEIADSKKTILEFYNKVKFYNEKLYGEIEDYMFEVTQELCDELKPVLIKDGYNITNDKFLN